MTRLYEIVAMLLCIPALLECCTHLAVSYIPTLYVVDHSINLPHVEVLLLLRARDHISWGRTGEASHLLCLFVVPLCMFNQTTITRTIWSREVKRRSPTSCYFLVFGKEHFEFLCHCRMLLCEQLGLGI